jgi:hypothetical protein
MPGGLVPRDRTAKCSQPLHPAQRPNRGTIDTQKGYRGERLPHRPRKDAFPLSNRCRPGIDFRLKTWEVLPPLEPAAPPRVALRFPPQPVRNSPRNTIASALLRKFERKTARLSPSLDEYENEAWYLKHPSTTLLRREPPFTN